MFKYQAPYVNVYSIIIIIFIFIVSWSCRDFYSAVLLKL